METNPKTPTELIAEAKQAVLAGDKSLALQRASSALHQEPNNIDALLIMAGLSDPQESVAYLNTVLDLDPNNPVAREAMGWAAQKMRKSTTVNWHPEKTEPIQPVLVEPDKFIRKKPNFAIPILLLGIGVLIYGLYSLDVLKPRAAAADVQFQLYESTDLVKPSLTPTNTLTPTITPTFISTFTPTFTNTPTATATETPQPTDIPSEVPVVEVTYVDVPIEEPYVETEVPEPTEYYEPGGTKWIDIDLSQQMLYAYEGDTIVGAFLVSTGLPDTPTVTGQYYVYVKYYYADMSGPGYYLPDVPYTMYFYDGYGIHGTYWHYNFGTPMSHGCVNMETSEAGWLFEWAYVGILVNIHY